MDMLKIIGISLALVSPALCQYYQQGGGGGGDGGGQYQQQQQEDQYNYQKRPIPQILTHKQALNHDGNFKYLFTSENGLAQGETIAPDGSRNGGYSYVDPTGRKISVKYTAGKEGFRILEADHLPKAPLPLVPVPQAAPQQQQAYAAPQSYLGGLGRGGQQDDGQYRPQLYQRPQQPQYNAGIQYNAQPRAYQLPQAPISNAIEKEPEYNDEPGKANSFGTGYVFEFAG